ncbi:lipopolysaccharide biosynthesis protein [Luteimonas sp. SX5]|uniref:Lipopolysaccharide biosynthesis protein n=1 Tax=Luteimonas galliterrae TaxID=2940486 RepID=A0ABT0MFF9_9GAMM|nr:lipopolysaccharide biosynthesis protein [Luteimonas galliterrae]MCL1633588.1 lipopolysaccharide biosynthesis protein [Luteimonas galliterrae]
MPLAGWLALHFAIGLLGTIAARWYALRARLLDQPGERRSHRAATPRGGGIAIVAAGLAAVAWLWAQDPSRRPWLAGFGVGFALVAAIGWIDDHRPLSPWLRLAVHALAAAALAWGSYSVHGDALMALATFVLSIGLTNVWNFMDGIDGLAASQAALLAAGAAWVLGGSLQWLALALCAACCGFLPLNVPRARIFLGDVGSGALGFAVAALYADLAAARIPGWPLSLLPLSAFLVDAALTLVGRMLRGERWWTPHVMHAYQVSARRWGHVPVTLAYAGWTLIAIALWWSCRDRGTAFITMLLFGWYTLSVLAWRGLRRGRDLAVLGTTNSRNEE